MNLGPSLSTLQALGVCAGNRAVPCAVVCCALARLLLLTPPPPLSSGTSARPVALPHALFEALSRVILPSHWCLACVRARWLFRTGMAVRSSPAVMPDGTVVVGSQDGQVGRGFLLPRARLRIAPIIKPSHRAGRTRLPASNGTCTSCPFFVAWRPHQFPRCTRCRAGRGALGGCTPPRGPSPPAQPSGRTALSTWGLLTESCTRCTAAPGSYGGRTRQGAFLTEVPSWIPTAGAAHAASHT